MKRLIITALLAMAPQMLLAETNLCGTTTSEVNNDHLYANVISRSHMDLELMVINKKSQEYQLYAVVGGKNLNASDLPSCYDSSANLMTGHKDVFASWVSGGSLAFNAAYKICVSTRGPSKTLLEYIVCNQEVGD